MKTVLLKVIFVLALLLSLFALSNPQLTPSRQNRFVIQSDILKHLVLGQRLLMADMFWIRLVQEIDFSETKGVVVNQGWTFHMLDAVTTLDPRYWMAYRAGLTVLSVLVQDVEGAKVLYERAIVSYPKDWPLHYRAAYHYLYEVKDCKRAADLLVKSGELGAPNWVSALAGRLYTHSGQKDLARTVLVDAIERFKGSDVEDRLRERLNSLESQTSQSHLNSEIKCK